MKPLKYILFAVLTLALAFIAFLVIMTFMDYKPGAVEPAITSGESTIASRPDSTLSIMTWNLGYFGLGSEMDFFYDGGKGTRPRREYYEKCSADALKYLSESEKAEVYFFQEVDVDSKRSYHDDQVGRIAKVFPVYTTSLAVNYQVYCVPVPLSHPMGKVKSGIVTLSAFPTSENIRYAFPGGFSWPVGLFMLDRCFMLTRVKHPSGHDIVLINTHNEAFDNGSQRRQQMAVLRETMLREYNAGNYVIVGGDWNLNPIGYNKDDLVTGDPGRIIEPALDADFLIGGWKWAFDPTTPTNRDVDEPYRKGSTPTTIIDFFVVSPNVSVERIKTEYLGFKWSDHNPVRITLKLGKVTIP